MPFPACEIASRLLQAIVDGQWPWCCAVGLVLTEAEASGPEAAGSALRWLEAFGWVERWHLPATLAVAAKEKTHDTKAVPASPARTESLQVTLTPWGLAQLGQWDLDLDVVENQTGEREWFGWPGSMPDCYRLPIGDRMPSIHDPRLIGVVEEFSTAKEDDDADDDREYLADHKGEIVMMFGRPVAVASSWGAAKRADDAAKADKRKGKVA